MQIYKSNSKELFHLQRYHDRVNMNYIQNHNTNVLKFIDKEQLKILQQISENILTGNTPLTSKELHELSHHKNFLRKLRGGKISKTLLIKNYSVIHKLVNISLKHDAKISPSTFGTMGKNKRSKNTSERSDSESSSSGSSEFQEEEEEEEERRENEID